MAERNIKHLTLVNGTDIYHFGGEALAMTGAASGLNGAAGYVPTPLAGDQAKFLRGDGTWQSVIADVPTTVDFEDISFSASVPPNSDWTQVLDSTDPNDPVLLGYEYWIENASIASDTKFWIFLNSDFYSNAVSEMTVEARSGKIVLFAQNLPSGTISGVVRIIKTIPSASGVSF